MCFRILLKIKYFLKQNCQHKLYSFKILKFQRLQFNLKDKLSWTKLNTAAHGQKSCFFNKDQCVLVVMWHHNVA
jgi:hypothetical protein